MFYSHEILTNSQYGVATIWLVATIGTSNQKKLNKKAIQDVNVPKACHKIMIPGAPLALRLQGNLLYGVSRVFSQQCGYVLSDAEKTQSDMMTFFRAMQTSEVDPKAGRTKRQNIILEDDPNFDPMSTLPQLDLLDFENEPWFQRSQQSSNQDSYFTLRNTQSQLDSLQSEQPQLQLNFHLTSSSSSQRSILPFGTPDFGSKPEENMEFNPFGDNDFELGGIELEVDANGEIVRVVDGLPELSRLSGAGSQDRLPLPLGEGVPPDQGVFQAGDNNGFIPVEAPLPDAEPFGTATDTKKQNASSTRYDEFENSGRATAAIQRLKHRQTKPVVDEDIRIHGKEFRRWSANYVDNMAAALHESRKAITVTRARRNAHGLLFGNGIGNVAYAVGTDFSTHPLTTLYSGRSLESMIFGDDPERSQRRGRRRCSAEAFGGEGAQASKKRHRTDEAAAMGLGQDDSFNGLDLGDDSHVEMGRDPGRPIDERHSSMGPGSSLRGPGSTRKGQTVVGSPIHGPASNISFIDRPSDPAEPGSNISPFPACGSPFSSDQAFLPADGEAPHADSGTGTESQMILRFMKHITRAAIHEGEQRDSDEGGKLWVDFERVAPPKIYGAAACGKHFAAQAFLHVLSLATTNALRVEQDGIEAKEPFGAIRIGVFATNQDSSGSDTG